MIPGDSRDHEIMRADHLATSFQIVANLGVMVCGRIIKREQMKRSKCLLNSFDASSMVSVFSCAVQQLGSHNGTDRNVNGWSSP